MHRYWGFGLTIASDIVLPGLVPPTGPLDDVRIRLGRTPQSLAGPDVYVGVGFSASPTEYLLTVNGIGNFYAANGTTIVVQPEAGGDEDSIRLFLFSNALTALLYQRDCIPFRASAILAGQGAVLFCGAQNSGKSTLVAALVNRGHRFFSDGPCIFSKLQDEAFRGLVSPSHPSIALWEDGIRKAGLVPGFGTKRIRPLLPKFEGRFPGPFDPQPQPVRLMFVLERATRVAEPQVQELSGQEAFFDRGNHLSHPLQFKAMKKQPNLFRVASSLTGVRTIRISRPYRANTVNELASLVESYL